MKKKLLIALIALTAALCGAFGFAACGDKDGGNSGTYYFVDIDGSVVKNAYYELNSGKWKNSDGESGSYETNGNKIIFYSEFMGEKEEWASAVLDNGVLTVTDGLSKEKYISEKHKHSYGEWETVSELSCTVDGVKERKCSCGIIDKDVTKCVGYHTGDISIKEATCIEKGLITGYCTVCQKDINEELDFADHKMSDWQMNEDSHYKVCLVCGTVGDVEEHTGTGKCKVCEYPLVATEGLQFTLNDDKNSYTLTGIGNVTDKIIRIPDSYKGLPVTAIGETAFIKLYTVSVITNIIIPDSVTSIDYYAFSGCSSLTSIIIPDGVTSIGGDVFYDCSSLTSITLGDSVTSIGRDAFSGCSSLTSITVSTNNKTYASQSGILYNKTKTELIYIPQAIVSAIIPDSIIEIGYEFQNHESLSSITIPDSVTSISRDAFNGCEKLIQKENGVSYVDKWVIDCDETVTEVTLRNDTKGIVDGVFGGLSLTSINIDKSNKNYKSIDGNLYIKDGTVLIQYATGKTETSFVVPDSVTSIGEYAFGGCSSLTSITLGDSVTSIGSSAFNGCSSLTSITIPDSVTSIGNWVFNGCKSLTIYCEAKSKYVVDWDAYWNIYNRQFDELPVVWDCKNNDKDSDGYEYEVIDGIKYSFKNGQATVSRQPSNIMTANIPATVTHKNIKYSVTSIGYEAFSGRKSLTGITIPDSVTSIGGSAFKDCISLANITIPDSIIIIGRYAFEGCNNLRIETESGIKYLGKWVISCDTSAVKVTLRNDTKGIADYAFYYCKSLTSIAVPKGVKSIGNSAFESCTALTKITIPDGVTAIGDLAFNGCSSFISITIPDSVTYIGDSAFSGCTSLTSITIPDSVTSIGDYTFYSCDKLTSIIIPDNVTSIGKETFKYCTSLKSVTIPNSVTIIEDMAFSDCEALTDINFKGTKEQWKAIERAGLWDNLTGNYTVHCTDGDITK